MTNSNAKGKRGELEARDAMKQHLGIDTHRTAQVDGKMSADLAGWHGVHVEVKHYAKIAAIKHMRQAERDSLQPNQVGGVPIVLMRENGDTEFTVMVRLSDLKSLCEQVAAIEGKPIYPGAGK